jgi:hypothetical protein
MLAEIGIGLLSLVGIIYGPCHVSGIFLPLRVNSLPLATIYEVKIPLRKWKKSFLQRNPAQMTWAIVYITWKWDYWTKKVFIRSNPVFHLVLCLHYSLKAEP